MADEGQAVDTGTVEGTPVSTPEPVAAPAAPAPKPSILDGKTFQVTDGSGEVKTTKGSQSLADLKALESKPAEETGKEKDASVKDGESEPPAAKEEKAAKKDEKPAEESLHDAKDPKGVTKRIDRAVAGEREAERRAEAAILRAEAAEKKLAAQQPAVDADGKPVTEAGKGDVDTTGKPARPVAPKMDDFDNIDDYEAAREKYTDEGLPEYFEKLSDWQTKQAQTTWEENHLKKTREAEDKRRIDAAVEIHPDFVAIALENGLPYTDVMAETICDSENFADLAMHMGMNPEETVRISKLSTSQQVYEIAKIDLGLKSKTNDESTVTPAVKPAGKQTTAADAPINPIAGGGVTAPFDPATASPKAIKDYLDGKRIAELKGSGALP